MVALETFWRPQRLWGIDEVVGAYPSASVAINANFTFDKQKSDWIRVMTRRCHGRLVTSGVYKENVSSDNSDPNIPAPQHPLSGSVLAGPDGKYIAMTVDHQFSMCKGMVPLSALPREAMGGWHTHYSNGNQNQLVGIGQVGQSHRMIFTATLTAGSGFTAAVAADAKTSGVPPLPGGDADDMMLIVGDANTSIALAYKDPADQLKVVNKGLKHTWVAVVGAPLLDAYCINTYLIFTCNKARQ